VSSYPSGDPLLKGRDWEAVKAYHRAQRAACTKCGHPIDYDGPAGPRSLDVGHIVGRAEAKRLGWTRAQINAISNTQAECRTCSRSTGARDGNHLRGRARPEPLEADEW
jgi:hypothetical protein